MAWAVILDAIFEEALDWAGPELKRQLVRHLAVAEHRLMQPGVENHLLQEEGRVQLKHSLSYYWKDTRLTVYIWQPFEARIIETWRPKTVRS